MCHIKQSNNDRNTVAVRHHHPLINGRFGENLVIYLIKKEIMSFIKKEGMLTTTAYEFPNSSAWYEKIDRKRDRKRDK